MSYYLNIAFAIVLVVFIAYIFNLIRGRIAIKKEIKMLENLK
jgi:CcmD family protein